jgi:beta-N-acetylhexosaminidase
MRPLAAIFGCAGKALTAAERALYREADPLGFILFARNIGEPGGVKALVADMRNCVGRADAPVLIDQEGGRVARLKPPHWRKAPPALAFVERARAQGEGAALAALRNNFRLIARDLAELGITVDCAPVADVPVPGAHDVIGDRAYGSDPAAIGRYGRAVADGLLDGGVLPVLKHIPGHGRARADSHLELPIVGASAEELERSDFVPFKALADLPWGMTAHVKFLAFDPERPATISPVTIEAVIRRRIGFQGLLLSDDLSMQALAGDMGARALASLDAGCDVVLHCNGDFAEMKAVAASARPLNDAALARVQAAETLRRARAQAGFDEAAVKAELDAFLAA